MENIPKTNNVPYIEEQKGPNKVLIAGTVSTFALTLIFSGAIAFFGFTTGFHTVAFFVCVGGASLNFSLFIGFAVSSCCTRKRSLVEQESAPSSNRSSISITVEESDESENLKKEVEEVEREINQLNAEEITENEINEKRGLVKDEGSNKNDNSVSTNENRVSIIEIPDDGSAFDDLINSRIFTPPDSIFTPPDSVTGSFILIGDVIENGKEEETKELTVEGKLLYQRYLKKNKTTQPLKPLVVYQDWGIYNRLVGEVVPSKLFSEMDDISDDQLDEAQGIYYQTLQKDVVSHHVSVDNFLKDFFSGDSKNYLFQIVKDFNRQVYLIDGKPIPLVLSKNFTPFPFQELEKLLGTQNPLKDFEQEFGNFNILSLEEGLIKKLNLSEEEARQICLIVEANPGLLLDRALFDFFFKKHYPKGSLIEGQILSSINSFDSGLNALKVNKDQIQTITDFYSQSKSIDEFKEKIYSHYNEHPNDINTGLLPQIIELAQFEKNIFKMQNKILIIIKLIRLHSLYDIMLKRTNGDAERALFHIQMMQQALISYPTTAIFNQYNNQKAQINTPQRRTNTDNNTAINIGFQEGQCYLQVLQLFEIFDSAATANHVTHPSKFILTETMVSIENDRLDIYWEAPKDKCPTLLNNGRK